MIHIMTFSLLLHTSLILSLAGAAEKGHAGLTGEEASKVLIPRPSDASVIITDGGWHNDFCLIRDKTARWHCIGIGGPDRNEFNMFHAVGESLDKPFTYIDKIECGVEPKANYMWAPFAIWKDDTTAYLFYAHIFGSALPDPKCGNRWMEQFSMRILVSEAMDLSEWEPLKGTDGKVDNIAFKEQGDRDPCIFWDVREKTYLMYYASYVPDIDPPGKIQVRKSDDLIKWSAPRSVISAPPGYRHPESPFVLFRDGYYYMWVSGYNYKVMSLYISQDPFNFGDPEKNRIEEQDGHADEIVSSGGTDYMADVRKQVRVRRIEWVPANERMLSKIVVKANN